MIKVRFEVINLEKVQVFYEAEVACNTNAFVAMKDAMNGHFEYKEYPGQGVMITKINGEGGLINGIDYYWALYVENIYSQHGIANFNITETAKNILWKL